MNAIRQPIEITRNEVAGAHQPSSVMWFERVGRRDVASVGGKNASLGEMVQTLAPKGIRVPPGFATTAEAYWDYVDANG